MHGSRACSNHLRKKAAGHLRKAVSEVRLVLRFHKPQGVIASHFSREMKGHGSKGHSPFNCDELVCVSGTRIPPNTWDF